MALDFIEEIYSNAETLIRVRKSMEYCRRTQDLLFSRDWEETREVVAAFCRAVVLQNESLGTEIWDRFVQICKEVSDGNLGEAADQIEEVLPLLYKAMEPMCQIDVEEGAYRFFSSKSGFISIQDLRSKKFLSSRIDPAWEGYEQALSLYQPKMKRFATMGCGLGYLCWQMYEVSNRSIDIYVYDTDEQMVEFAKQFGVLDRIPEENLHVIIKKNANQLLESFADQLDAFKQEEAVLSFDENTLDKLSDAGRAIFNRIESMIATAKDFSGFCEQNYYRNRNSVKFGFADLLKKEHKEEWIVVGGGPSLDDHLNYLRESMGKKTIIAATTVYKKLLSEGIKPEYIATIDPQRRTYGHLEGVMDHDADLIMTGSANWQFGEKYKGRRYMIPLAGNFYTDDYYMASGMKESEKWYACGTVASFCVEIAARLGAKNVELIGIDLAYPTDHSHAKGTMDDKEVNYEGMLKVKGVNGQPVYTSRIFSGYIQDLEEQIEQYAKKVTFYNLSDCGAYIKGCKRLKK